MATFTVTNTADSGAGSLRQAVLDANAADGRDAIVFAASFDGGAEDVIRLTSGQIAITGALRIDGGPGVTITGDAAGDDVTDAAGITDVAASGARRLDDNSRIFDASDRLTLDGLTLTGGRTTADGEGGGAVRSTEERLTLIDSTVSGNSTAGSAASGGGIGAVYGASVTLTNSMVSGNSTAGHFARGGGIHSDYGSLTVTNSIVSGNGTAGRNAEGGGIRGGYITLTNSTVSGNSTAGRFAGGGGISGDAITLTNSTVRGNSTAGDLADGGGIYSFNGYITLTNSLVSGNSTAGDSATGGGIDGYAITLTDSTVSGNSTAGDFATGGGIAGEAITLTDSTVSGNGTAGDLADGGGIYSRIGPLTLTNSIVSGNSTVGDYAAGGGIHGDVITLTDSTVSGNRTAGDGADGGGIYGGNRTGTPVTLTNSTVSGNSTIGNYADGGGIWIPSHPGNVGEYRVHLTNSIVLGNRASSAGADEIYGVRVLTGGNIVGTDVFSGMSDVGNATAGRVFDATRAIVDGVRAGRLADNGGPTRTIALNPDAFNPALGGADPGKAPARDQRGLLRDAAPDLGAFEAGPVDGLVLLGRGKAERLTGSALPDQVYGRGGNDILLGLAGGDQLRGEFGDDRLRGGRGSDALDGSAGQDRLRGGPGDDQLSGRAGGDHLRGGRGDDLLWGGKGPDTFVFAGKFGHDAIEKFDARPAGGQDWIDLRAFGMLPERFDEIVSIEDLGADTRIRMGGGASILCRGVSGDGANTIDEADFLL